MKKILLLSVITLLVSTKAWGGDYWLNDLRTLFLTNKAVIYVINIRTFNANDKNGNGIIEEELGEERGSFVNAVDRLDELTDFGINTIHVLPITPVGKTKALGTAGSLYSAAAFDEINPQLKDKNSKLSLYEEARRFVEECHKRKIRVIVDLPSCGSYDLYLKNPELFVKDKTQNPVIPVDWTDVRLLDAGTNSNLNIDVYNLYRDFANLMISLDVDGIRADVATIKPYEFWKKLITETRRKSPQFMFLAEASEAWKEKPSEYAVFTTYDKLLDAGFDGYYGSYFNLKNWKTANELYQAVNFNLNLAKKYPEGKSAIGSFSTHDEISPLLINGPAFSKMIIWLNTTLPLNPYYVDGFSTGETYLYPLANKKALKSFTDDDYYFVHRGQLDIFNFSRKPISTKYDIAKEFLLANKFRESNKEMLSKASFSTFKTSNESVFAYARTNDKSTIFVIGNLDFKRSQTAIVNIPRLNSNNLPLPIKISSIPTISKGKISTNLAPGEIMVLLIEGL